MTLTFITKQKNMSLAPLGFVIYDCHEAENRLSSIEDMAVKRLIKAVIFVPGVQCTI
jgi:hypothetical protein